MSKSKEHKKGINKKIIIAIIAIVILVIGGLFLFSKLMTPKTIPIEDSTVFDSEAVETKCVAVIMALDEENYELLQSEYANEQMKSVVTKDQIEKAKASMNVEWDKKAFFQDMTILELTQNRTIYAVAKVPVTYGEDMVTYTMTFDEEYKLAGLYMK